MMTSILQSKPADISRNQAVIELLLSRKSFAEVHLAARYAGFARRWRSLASPRCTSTRNLMLDAALMD